MKRRNAKTWRRKVWKDFRVSLINLSVEELHLSVILFSFHPPILNLSHSHRGTGRNREGMENREMKWGNKWMWEQRKRGKQMTESWAFCEKKKRQKLNISSLFTHEGSTTTVVVVMTWWRDGKRWSSSWWEGMVSKSLREEKDTLISIHSYPDTQKNFGRIFIQLLLPPSQSGRQRETRRREGVIHIKAIGSRIYSFTTQRDEKIFWFLDRNLRA